MSATPIKCAILFSGNGSNMQNIIESLHHKICLDSSGEHCFIDITITLCNNPNAFGIKRLEALNIPCIVLNHKDFSTRQAFDNALIKALEPYNLSYIFLAGFMRILSPSAISAFRIINIHPSFLPDFKGAHAIKDCFNSDVNYGGVSVHWVSEELDSGEVIMQEKVLKAPNESLEDFEAKIHALEYTLYPKAILKALGLARVESTSLESALESTLESSANTNSTPLDSSNTRGKA